MASRGLGNKASIQCLCLSVQVLDISLDKGSGQEDSIELRLLGDNGCQSSRNLRNESADDSKNGVSFFGSYSTRNCTAVSTSLLETSFENLLLRVDGKGTTITASTSEDIDLYI